MDAERALGRLGFQSEGWVAVGYEQGGVALDAGCVASDAYQEVKEGAGVAGGDDDHDPAERARLSGPGFRGLSAPHSAGLPVAT